MLVNLLLKLIRHPRIQEELRRTVEGVQAEQREVSTQAAIRILEESARRAGRKCA